MNNTDNFISVVVPVYNEQENLPVLITRLVDVLKNYRRYEVVFVNDGSVDLSETIIRENAAKNSSIKLINLSRNFGHQTAISAGIFHASGDAVLIMDGDLQDPPEIIPQFVDKWKEGYDVVYAIRQKRKENIFKRFAYFSFYRILRKISDIEIPLDSGDFSIMDRKIVDLMNSFPERNRFVRGVRAWLGFKQIGLAYQRDGRFAGRPKYSFSALFKLSYDGIISFSKRPLQIASYLGITMTVVAFVGILYLLFLKIFFGIALQGWTSLFIVVIFIGGIQTLMIGIIGEYIGRIFDEVKGRPYFLVKELVNVDDINKKEM